LLFYHFTLRRFVVVELKSVKFDLGMVGQLHMYLSTVDDMLKQPDDQPTIGLLLCRGKKSWLSSMVLTVLHEMKLAKGKNTLLWPGAKLDKFDEQLPRNKTSVFRPFKAAVIRAGLPKKLLLHDLRPHLRRSVPRIAGVILKLQA
jgi:hypothetical protein